MATRMKHNGLIKMFSIQWKEQTYHMCAHINSTDTTIGGDAWIAPNPLPVDIRPFVAWIVNTFWSKFPTDNPTIPLIEWAHQFKETSELARDVVKFEPLFEKQSREWKDNDLSRWPS
jgi:hypothetical protein